MAKLIYFIVFDNNKKVFDLCPTTKKNVAHAVVNDNSSLSCTLFI